MVKRMTNGLIDENGLIGNTMKTKMCKSISIKSI